MSEADRSAVAQLIWKEEHVELATIGIDIGSSTSHLLFAKVLLVRQAQGLSSRFVPVHRQVVWRSPIMLTPLRSDGAIDADRLGAFIATCYRDAGLARDDIDTGAVILTGEAIKRRNARAIDELFAAEAGKFVCATAGHKLECTLAAHGAGAVRLSRQRDQCLLHVDIGGGTMKLALIDRGTILGVAAVAIGGRLIACDESGTWSRIADSARLLAQALGLPEDAATFAQAAARTALTRRLAAIAADYILGVPPDAQAAKLLLTEPLLRAAAPAALSFSGGVAEYVFAYEERSFGDIGKELAAALRDQLKRRTALPLIDPGQRIRATVIGASQFTVQVSGKTIYLPRPQLLPARNLPVVHLGRSTGLDWEGPIDAAAVTRALKALLLRLDIDADCSFALAFSWEGDPDYARLLTTAQALASVLAPGGQHGEQECGEPQRAEPRRGEPLFLMIDGDIGKTFGRILAEEIGIARDIVAVDGVALQELDFVDIGEMISPPGVVPVVIKSLLFT